MRGFADPGLADAVPSVGRWREAGVPQFPARPAIERLLESCDRPRRVGGRDFAIYVTTPAMLPMAGRRRISGAIALVHAT
jgi:hypothetical protein